MNFTIDPVHMQGLGIAQYIAIGDGLKFLSQISFHRGFRLILERIAMQCRTRSLDRKIPHDEDISQAIELLEKAFFPERDKPLSCLFLRTHWYKSTVMIGCIDIQGAHHFIKVFKKESDARREADQTLLLSDLYGQWFEVPRVETCTGRLLSLSYLPRHRWPSEEGAFRLITNALQSWKNNAEIQMASLDTLIQNFKSLASSFRRIGFSEQKFRRMLSDLQHSLSPLRGKYPVHLSHGDMTPWNMHVTASGKMVLVDSERVSERSIYADLLHFIVQKPAVARFSFASPGCFIQLLSKSTCIEKSEAMQMLALYLVEELAIDGVEMNTAEVQIPLYRAFVRKTNWLIKTISALNKK